MFTPYSVVLCTNLINLLQAVLAAPYASSTVTSRDDSSKPVKFELNLTWEDNDNVGTAKKTILMNEQSPGPVLEMDFGDTVEFLVHNNLPFETAVHFHGITQFGTPWNDGVPGVSQTAIQPGQSYLYRWTADEYGTYFYHAHYRGQIADGFSGPILIHPPAEQEKPFALISSSPSDQEQMAQAVQSPKPIMVSDWQRITYEELFDLERASGVDIYCTDATIINGKGSVYCPGQDFINTFVNPQMVPILNGSQYTAKGCLPPLDSVQGPYPRNLDALPSTVFDICEPTTGSTEVIEVDPADGWASLNFISSSSISTFDIAVDEHPMWIYEVDGRYINPQLVNQVTIANGFRYSALIKLDQPVSDYTIRVTTNGLNQIVSGYATLTYAGSSHMTNSTAIVNYGGGPVSNSSPLTRFNEAGATPFEPVTPAQTADQTFFFNVGHWYNSWQWTISGNAAYDQSLEDATVPPLLIDPDQDLGHNPDLTIRTTNGTWVDLIIRSQEPLSPPHPIHKHSNKFFVIGSGVGPFNYSSVAEAIQKEPAGSFNLANPQLRDGYAIAAVVAQPTWLALRYQVVQPGAFLLHCHLQIHLGGGMSLNVLDGVDAWPQLPGEYLNGNGGTRS